MILQHKQTDIEWNENRLAHATERNILFISKMSHISMPTKAAHTPTQRNSHNTIKTIKPMRNANG